MGYPQGQFKMIACKRRRVYVDRRVQYQLARRVILHWLGFVVIAIVLAIGTVLFSGHPILPLYQFVQTVIAQQGLFLVLLVALIPAFVYDTIKFSNRFAGPVMRTRRALRAAADGYRVKPLRFRNGDLWPELASEFNRLLERIDTLESRIAELDAPETVPSAVAIKTVNAALESVATAWKRQ